MKKHYFQLFLILAILAFLPVSSMAGSATLNWQPNPENDLDGYRVYYGTSSRSYGPPLNVNTATTCTLDKLSDGATYYFAVTAYDTSGNESGFSDEVQKSLNAPDTSAPTVAFSSPTSGGSYATGTSALTVSGTAADNVGVTQVAWSNDRGGSGTASGTTSWKASNIQLSAGTNILTFTARDAASNHSSKTLVVTYNAPDTSAPTVSLSTPTSGGSYATESAAMMVTGTATDNVGVTQVAWNNDRGGSGTEPINDNGSWTVGNIALYEGTNNLAFTAEDAAGNKGSKTLTVTYTAPVQASSDQVAPAVRIVSPTSRSNYFSRIRSVDLAGTAFDNIQVAKITWKNSRGETGTASGTQNWDVAGIPLDRWSNTVTITAHDAAGNTSTASLRVFCWR
jgi:fibronectin type 3 domain-containing protein